MEGKQAYALTYPLITKDDGSKVGKSTGGAVWLDAAKTSPYAFHQFWRNTGDSEVIAFLKIFSFLDLEEIELLVRAMEQDPGMRVPQIRLAEEVTRLVHGEEGLSGAIRIGEALFANTIDALAESDLAQLALDGLPVTPVATEEISLIDALVESGLALTPRGEVTSGQARKLIKSSAVSVNGEKVKDESYVLSRANGLFGRYQIIRKGKKNHHLVVFE